MKKYIMAQECFLSDEMVESLLIERGKLSHENVYVSWWYLQKDWPFLNSPIYLEIRRELTSPFDFSILKREVNEVVDELAERLVIDKECIRIYFNGNDGFFVYIPNFATGLSPSSNINKIIKNIAVSLRKYTCISDIRDDIYEVDSTHILFDTMNYETGLYLVNLSLDMLNGFTHKELVKYATNKQKGHHYTSCMIDVPDDPVPGLIELIGEPDDECCLLERFIGDLSLDKIESFEGAYERLKQEYYDEEYLLRVVSDGRANYEHDGMEASQIENEEDRKDTISFKRYMLISVLVTRIIGPWKHMAILALKDVDFSSGTLEHCVCGFYGEGEIPNVDLSMYLKYWNSCWKDLYIVNEFVCISQRLSDMSYEDVLNAASLIVLNVADNVKREYKPHPMFEYGE